MIYDIPQDIIEIFDLCDRYYYISGNDIGHRDNVEMMTLFKEMVNIDEVLYDDGTQIVLKHPKYNYNMVIDSYGGGDSYTHIFEAYKEDYTKRNLNLLEII